MGMGAMFTAKQHKHALQRSPAGDNTKISPLLSQRYIYIADPTTNPQHRCM